MSGAVLETDIDSSIESQAKSDSSPTQIVTFRLGRESYGIGIMHVQEIILIGQITRLPNVPEYVTGLINLRGHVIPIIDMRKRFFLTEQALTENSRIIVLNVNTRTIGIIVDAVNQVLRVAKNQIEPAPQTIHRLGLRYLTGLVKLQEELLFLLNGEQLAMEVRDQELEG